MAVENSLRSIQQSLSQTNRSPNPTGPCGHLGVLCQPHSCFLTWVIEQDFLSKLHDDNLQDAAGVKERRITGFEFLSNHCDLVLSREDLSRKIVKFVDLFYEDYIEQYCEFMENKLHKTVLGTTFSWEDYALIKANIIDPGYHKYLNNQSCK